MMNLKIHKAAMLMAALVLLLPLRAVAQANTYYDRGGVNPTNPRQVLKTRMALVGHNCMVSRFPDGVAVGSRIKGLSNLCDENLDNYCDLPGVADVTLLAGSPIVAVKDMKHYFDKHTKAGFNISAESNVLKLSLLETSYRIRFYKDGKILKDSKIEQAGFSVLNLSLGNIAAGSTLDIVAAEQPTEDYDEIALIGQSGIKADAVKGLKIYYAFVGNGEYTLTKSRMKEYDTHFGTSIKLNAKSSDVLDPLGQNLIDDDLSNSTALAIVVSFGAGYAQVIAKDNNNTSGETFPKGTEAGFVYTTGGLLGLGETAVIHLLDRNGNELYKKSIDTKVLSLDLGGEAKKVSIKAPCDFSGIKLKVEGAKVAKVLTAKYAFISPEPTTAGHPMHHEPDRHSRHLQLRGEV